MDILAIGLQVTLFGVGAVFIALGVLSTLLSLQASFIAQKNRKMMCKIENVHQEVSVQQAKDDQQGTPPDNELVDTELVAIITAAITQMMVQQSGYIPHFRITSIAPTSDVWRMRGRENLVSSR